MSAPEPAQDVVASRWHAVARGAGALLARGAVLLGLTLVTLEVLFRVAYPDPPVQIIRPTSTALRVVRGVPVWEDHDSAPRQNDACAARWPDAERVVFLGSSITYGSGVSASEAFPARLQHGLDSELGEGRVCVQNLAQPGNSFLNKLVALEEVLAAAPPAMVVWEVWHNDLHDFAVMGDTAYSLRDLPVSDDGYPVGPLPSGAPHRWLFRNLRAYEYTTLVVAARNRLGVSTPPERLDRIAQVGDACRAAGVGLALLFAPQLDRPFREQLGHANHPLMRRAAAWAEAAGVPVVPLADVLRDDDYLELRRDPCCHYNPAGHARIADELLAHPTLGPLLRAPRASSGSAEPR